MKGEATILPPRSCDAEVAGIMDELGRLQTWLTLHLARSRGDRDALSAIDLVQRTRVLIVERLFDERTPDILEHQS